MSVSGMLNSGSGGASGGSGYTGLQGSPVTIDGWEPPIVTKSRATIEGNVDTITDQCGHTEAQKNGDRNITYMCEGLVKKSQLGRILDLGRRDEVSVSAEALGSYSGTYIVQDCWVEQRDEEVSYKDATSAVETAFFFQIQFKEPESPTS